ncbi:hypothetical protein [Acidiferrobacter sp.]|jgi:hypothetical protein|uniref:hypothetical protein n=1 Tax=Acidiferrobacter sp. TaxID=1872107 RepID=UPI002615944B|nr:hypothetical protein [Acidiferrobacter sp.]
MLSQAIYWTNRTSNPDGWFWKTQQQWEAETGMGRREQETARARLRETPFWKEKRTGIPARMFFRVDLQQLEASLIGAGGQSSMAQSAKLDERNPPNRNGGTRQTGMAPSAILYTETISETSTESTAETTSLASRDESSSHKAGDHIGNHEPLLSREVLDKKDMTPSPSTPPANGEIDSSPILMEMPIVGGQSLFHITQALRDSLAEAYPALDVDQCLRAARLWLEANPSRRKTARGMKRFLAGWLERDQNNGHNVIANPDKPSGNLYETNRRVAERVAQMVKDGLL